MRKILIISYFFPPCNLTAANRVGSWERYLSDYEIYPIIITRNWTGNELTEEERLMTSGDKIKHIKKEQSEIYYLPYQSSLRDTFFIKGENSKLFSIMSKLLTLFYLFMQNYTVKVIPYNNLYLHARKLLKENPSIKTLIISGNPFEQFFFGYLLKKKFPYITWIADYRDEWTTRYHYINSGFRFGLQKIEKLSEKKWLKNAIIISVTEYFLDRITTFHSKKGYVIENGYDNCVIEEVKKEQCERFLNKITYSGTIYDNQNFDLFFEGLLNYNHTFEKHIIISFVGSNIEIFKNNIFYNKLKANGWVELLHRMSYKNAIREQYHSLALLMVPYEKMEGTPSSKLYDYIGLSKPVILSPTDNDIIESYLNQTNQAIICNTVNDVSLALKKLNNLKININKSENYKFSRKFQTQKLATLLKSL